MMNSRSSIPYGGHKRSRSDSYSSAKERRRRQDIARKKQKAVNARERANEGMEDEDEDDDDDEDDSDEEVGSGGDGSDADVEDDGTEETSDSDSLDRDSQDSDFPKQDEDEDDDADSIDKTKSSSDGETDEEGKSPADGSGNSRTNIDAEIDTKLDTGDEVSEQYYDAQEEQASTRGQSNDRMDNDAEEERHGTSDQNSDMSGNKATDKEDNEDQDSEDVDPEAALRNKMAASLQRFVDESSQNSVKSDVEEGNMRVEENDATEDELSDEQHTHAGHESAKSVSPRDEDHGSQTSVSTEDSHQRGSEEDNGSKMKFKKGSHSPEVPASDTQSEQEQSSLSPPPVTSSHTLLKADQTTDGNEIKAKIPRGPLTRKRGRDAAMNGGQTPVARRTRSRTGNITQPPQPNSEDDLVPSARWGRWYWVSKKDNEQWLRGQARRKKEAARKTSSGANGNSSRGKKK